jgi:hypothetical protein
MAKTNLYRQAVDKRQKKDKQRLLAMLREMPIPAVACEKSGIGRTTYYSWLKKDKAFLHESEAAISEGDLVLNDMAKSQLVSLMKDKYWPTIKYHLDNRHPDYAKQEYRKVERESLTPEQEAVVRKALRLTARPKKK